MLLTVLLREQEHNQRNLRVALSVPNDWERVPVTDVRRLHFAPHESFRCLPSFVVYRRITTLVSRTTTTNGTKA